MKVNVFKVCAVILLSSALSLAYGQETEEAITSSGTVEVVEKEPVFHISDALVPYVSTYVKALKADNWDLTNVIEHDLFILFDYEIEEDLDTFNNNKGAAGIALGMNDDKLVYVVINIDAWVLLSDYGKQDLINHELMHDIFNVKHTDIDDEDKLMHPSSYPKNWGETLARLVGAISDLNNNL